MLAAVTASLTPLQAATEAQASAITREYDQAYQRWLSEIKAAPDARTREQIAKKRPNAAEYGTKLRSLLRKDLAKEWTLKYGAWLLENDPTLIPKRQRALLNAVEKYHMKSPLLGRFCMAMPYLNDTPGLPRPGRLPIRSRGIKMLEQIKKINPSPKVQGQAALALAVMLGELGDDPRVIQRRLANLRIAIKKSAYVKVGKLTVADIARDELFKIKHLTRGRVAPEIVGTDSAPRPLKLSDYRGKVVMLVFWSSWDPSAAKSLAILRKSVENKAGKPFVVLGVNRDTRTNLRTLEADRIVTWRNFSDPDQKIDKIYRINVWPYCLVLDQQGVIRYRGTPGAFADAVANELLRPKTKPAATQ